MIRFGILLLAAQFLFPGAATAITMGQVDDFEDGTTQGWSEGVFTPNPPANISSGGPMGAGDNYLENISSGEIFAAGGRMIQFNQAQWTGNYVAAGVTTIQMMAANFGSTTLHLRIAVEGAATQYGSTTAVVLPADGQWHPVTFHLTAAEMSLIGGPATLNGTLSSVDALRILSRQGGPGWQGDTVAGRLGVDVISAGSPSGVPGDAVPAARLLTNTPNPFAASTRIRYELTRAMQVRLEIFDLGGRRVRVLEADTPKEAGIHDQDWNGRDDAGNAAPAGIYFYRLVAEGTAQKKSMVLIRD